MSAAAPASAAADDAPSPLSARGRRRPCPLFADPPDADQFERDMDQLGADIEVHLHHATLMERRMSVAAQTDLLVNWAHGKSVAAKRQYATPDRPTDRSFKPVAYAPDDIYDAFMTSMLGQVRPVAARVKSGHPFQIDDHATRTIHASWWVEHARREADVRASNCQDGDTLMRLARIQRHMNTLFSSKHAYTDKMYA